MLAIGVIAAVDFVGDKVPALDSVLHAIGLVVAPVAGALVALAATGNDAVDPAFARRGGRSRRRCDPRCPVDRAPGLDGVHGRRREPGALAWARTPSRPCWRSAR